MRPSAMKKNLTIKLSISKTTQNVLLFLKNSKYIIFVITSFTVCWIPCILLVFLDSGYHAVGRLEESKKTQCGLSGQQKLTLRDQNIGQTCIDDLLFDANITTCDVPGDDVDACVAVHDYLHDFLVICIARIAMCMIVIGSFINPFIHGLWYPGFRQAVKDLKQR